ncbi:hypothetical protein PAAG_12409 [Paracoccidioides lutzii Pb01]|uniref:Uncharacterized protein n=1 Tax=Paracoccidioides lutzii (strain ATCC MYA-826 / Pb01) TaxID=502779 RepID=A0A0A2UZ97_PARBA|nr:hypothetical protein PAAG_12409 [Paracoccidioides lutzii Pb01]KGQ00906.1 hypothetical protein PAAG_12409 [Paracoccidioides lutzii Pb01]
MALSIHLSKGTAIHAHHRLSSETSTHLISARLSQTSMQPGHSTYLDNVRCSGRGLERSGTNLAQAGFRVSHDNPNKHQ